MQTTTITMTVKYSLEIKGAWKTIEVGQIAAIYPSDNLHACYGQLYANLTDELRSALAQADPVSPSRPPNQT